MPRQAKITVNNLCILQVSLLKMTTGIIAGTRLYMLLKYGRVRSPGLGGRNAARRRARKMNTAVFD
jgi:hypothetical protein